MTRILAFSGKKGSGKNTACNYLFGMYMQALGLIENFKIDDLGQLDVYKLDGKEEISGVFDVRRRDNDNIVSYLEENVFPFIKLYSFADLLKVMCIKIFGLSYSQCYGTDEEKNTQTSYRWKDMPGIFTNKAIYEQLCNFSGKDYAQKNVGVYRPKNNAKMTARELLQYVGTDIFRKIKDDIWVEALLNKIETENSAYAIIDDCRFPNEVKGVQRVGGRVIRLTRCPYTDIHKSETILDNYTGFDAVLDNQDMTIEQQNKALYKLLQSWNELPPNS